MDPVIITFLIVIIGWVFFRIEDISQAFLYLEKMFSFNLDSSNLELSNVFVFTLILAIIFSFINVFKFSKVIENKIFYNSIPSNRWYSVMIISSLCLIVLSVSSITTEGFNPFIYFRF